MSIIKIITIHLLTYYYLSIFFFEKCEKDDKLWYFLNESGHNDIRVIWVLSY